MKVITKFGLLLLAAHINTVYAFSTIILQNATSCKVTMKNNTILKTETVPAIDIFSFYYTSQNRDSLTYYSTIPAGMKGDAAVGDFNPSMSPPELNINLGFSPSPGYTAGSLMYVSSQANKFNYWYIYQIKDISFSGSYCALGPCIAIAYTNPCANSV